MKKIGHVNQRCFFFLLFGLSKVESKGLDQESYQYKNIKHHQESLEGYGQCKRTPEKKMKPQEGG